jgi:hypothetical protein
MIITFNDSPNLSFEYYPVIPQKTINKLNLAALRFYGFYRNIVYDAYQKKPGLAHDIKNYKKVYEEKEISTLSQDACYLNPLYHYSVTASLGAMQEWKDSQKNMRCYIASEYSKEKCRYIPVGFVHFEEAKVNNNPVVYIAQLGVTTPGKGIGRRLMECVLAHYPAGTEFYVLTRVFNTEAKTLYQKRFNFSSIQEEEIKQLGYDTRYCGFKHITLPEEIEAINIKMVKAATQLADNLEQNASKFTC